MIRDTQPARSSTSRFPHHAGRYETTRMVLDRDNQEEGRRTKVPGPSVDEPFPKQGEVRD